jgi:predicted outer membrane repeat protein
LRRYRSVGVYDKFFIIQHAAGTSFNTSVGYDDASFDYNDAAMRGLPFTSSIQKYSFCATPGNYMLHAIDTGGHGWWGGAFYVVVAGGETVLHKEMKSLTKQSTTFTVTLPAESARTSFTENKATRGGGGAIFFEEIQPENLEAYRNESDSNEATYGTYAATPIRTLSTRRSSYDAVSGESMEKDPITLDLRDG